MAAELHKADRGLRRIAAIAIPLALVLAIAVFAYLYSRMVDIASATTPTELVARMRQWLGTFAILSSACLLLLAVHAVRTARSARAQGRWPLAGSRTLRDHPIVHGEPVARRARLLNVVSLLLFGFAAAIAVVGWRLFQVGA